MGLPVRLGWWVASRRGSMLVGKKPGAPRGRSLSLGRQNKVTSPVPRQSYWQVERLALDP